MDVKYTIKDTGFLCFDSLEWCKDYGNQAVDSRNLQQEIDQYMQDYDKRVREVQLYTDIQFFHELHRLWERFSYT